MGLGAHSIDRGCHECLNQAQNREAESIHIRQTYNKEETSYVGSKYRSKLKDCLKVHFAIKTNISYVICNVMPYFVVQQFIPQPHCSDRIHSFMSFLCYCTLLKKDGSSVVPYSRKGFFI